MPENHQPGQGAGQFQFPGGIATDPATGHVFVADLNNARIVELTAWGEFVKTWGWGVVASGPDNQPAKNEKQSLTVTATAGTYRLTYTNRYRAGLDESFQTTVPIGFNWPATDPGTPGTIDSVEEALQNLASLKPFPGSVVVTGGPGDVGGSSPYQIEFVGQYADKDIPPLEAGSSTLSGGSASAGVATLQTGGSFEVCVPGNGDVCQAGQSGGSGPGEISHAEGGVAVDGGGNVYVNESYAGENRGEGLSIRVQKFSPAGEFELMVGGEVNKTKAAEPGSTEAERNLCTRAQVEAGDLCGTGVPGAGKGQFSSFTGSGPGNRIAAGPGGLIYVGDVGRIEKLTVAGAFAGELKTPEEQTVLAMQVDGEGYFYVRFDGNEAVRNKVRKLVAAGEALTQSAEFPADAPQDIALDGAGNLYVVALNRGNEPPSGTQRVLAYEPGGGELIANEEHFAETGGFLAGLATSEACGIPGADIYVSDFGGFVSAYGPAPLDVNACPPPKVAPAISRQFAIAADSESASVKAAINPQFWPDTRYYVEYGSGLCASGGCASTQPSAPGTQLTTQVVKQILATEPVLLSGLAPKTTYHYRFVAESTGGGPVFGIDPDGSGTKEASFEDGLEGTFTTQAVVSEEADNCPNAPFRIGAAAKRLPDCRAYEMVSPVAKENGDIITLDKVSTVPLSLNQSSVDGERLSFSSYRAFGDAQSAPITSTYLASRGAGGWGTHAISPTRGRNDWRVADSIESQFKAFSQDLCESWLISETDPPLSAGATPGYANVYHRENCGAGEGSYEALIPAADEAVGAEHFIPEFQGVSGDGKHALFRVIGQLSEDAVPCSVPGDFVSCKLQLYESQPGGGLSFVCVLPNETPAPNGCSAGSGSGENQNDGREHMVHNAISADGSRVFWSDRGAFKGKIYVRVDGTTTLAVSAGGEALSGGTQSQYWTAAADGSRAIFSTGGDFESGSADLYEFALEGEETTPIAGKLYGLLGASEDAKRIYLVSGEVHGGGTVNKPNLYLHEGGPTPSFTYIATLASADATSSVAFSPLNIVPRHHTAQVSGDGKALAFMSLAPLTGFDNADAQSGKPAAEVFHYDASSGQLRCVSCNPTGVSPSARNIGGGLELLAAAKIPFTQTQLYSTPKVLSVDGSRLYFESFEKLVGADANDKKDVYQWEQAGEGLCEESSPSFDPKAGGCVDLISSGQSEDDSSLIEVSAGANDVFFATAESLLSQDPALVDIYDARVEGGFPPAPAPKTPCEGEACQPPGLIPAEVIPNSAGFQGPANPTPKPEGRRCPKGKHLAKVEGKKRCVKNKNGGKSKNKAGKNRGARR